jgi:hypothetical protein
LKAVSMEGRRVVSSKRLIAGNMHMIMTKGWWSGRWTVSTHRRYCCSGGSTNCCIQSFRAPEPKGMSLANNVSMIGIGTFKTRAVWVKFPAKVMDNSANVVRIPKRWMEVRQDWILG